ncbi:MAG TPA: lipopolysaccharide heptosyltransferase II [Nitrospiria bacterium]|nr:lipopolysaccharide heptosyltransferase II [Nitrospiria bacterium]
MGVLSTSEPKPGEQLRRIERPSSALSARGPFPLDQIRNILVIKLRYIGDTVLITPVLESLRGALPDSSITAVVAKGTEPVLENHPAIDDVLPIDRTAPVFKYVNDLRSIRLKQADLAIDLTGADRSGFLARWSGAPIRMGYRGRNRLRNRLFYNVLIDADDGRLHRIDHHLVMIDAMGIPIATRSPRLVLSDDELCGATDLLRRNGLDSTDPYIVLHPGARRWYKCWPLDNFSRLADRIVRELRIPVILAGGETDRVAVETIERGMEATCLNLASRLNLRELSAVLKLAAICVVNDSSPMHLAAAVGTPTVSLFGLTDPNLWAPRGPNHLVISRDCPCRPYGHRRECPEGDNRCMAKISVTEVFNTICTLLPDPT